MKKMSKKEIEKQFKEQDEELRKIINDPTIPLEKRGAAQVSLSIWPPDPQGIVTGASMIVAGIDFQGDRGGNVPSFRENVTPGSYPR